MKLFGSTVLITGGGTGIGRALAESLHSRGNHVIVAGHRPDDLAEVAEANPGIEMLVLDVTDPQSIADGVEELLERHPDLNVVINNAGIATDDDLAVPIHDETLVRTFETNVFGPIRLISALITHLTRVPDAAIVNVTSMLGYVPLARAPLYCASKAAMHSFTLSLRYRLQREEVEVIEIAPPLTRTGLQDSNLVDPRAMPLDEFISETIAALEAGEAEAYVARARERRDAQRTGDIAAMQQFNDLMTGAEPAGTR